MTDIVENIRIMRKAKRISAAYLSTYLGYDASNWSKVESGKQNVRISDLDKIAKLLEVRVIDLFTYPDVYVLKNERVMVEVPASKLEKLENILNNL